MSKLWQIAPAVSPKIKEQFPEINPIVLQLLSTRGLTTQAQIDEFLNPDYGSDLHDPFLFLDMKKAVARIYQAISKKEKVLVYGDYDVDGVTATVLMTDSLKLFGLSPEIYIPFRETEGYGLNSSAVQKIIRKKIDLAIAVDCGIANFSEIKTLKKAGIDVLVFDHHHQLKKLPEALAIINPKVISEKYPFKELSACGVVFKVVQALLSEKERAKRPGLLYPGLGFEKWFLDLVALATVADLCPLFGENRTLVKYGLTVLQKSRRIGLLALAEAAGCSLKNINTEAIGFGLAPRINAAGRLDHASTAFKLLTAEDPTQARQIAQELNEKNDRRQKLTERIYQQAKKQIVADLEQRRKGGLEEQKVLLAYGENWSAGILGLVAGKLTDEFFRPVLVMGKNPDGQLVGSGRSIPSFDITKALESCERYLIHYGGHSQACGFTVKDETALPGFKRALNQAAEQTLSEKDLTPVLKIDCELPLSEVNWKLVEELEKFAPLGQGNKNPLFLAKNLPVAGLQPVGKDGKHLRVMVKDENGNLRKAIGFYLGQRFLPPFGAKADQRLKIGDRLDLVFEVGVNVWNGNQELQLKIADLKIAEKEFLK